MLEIAKIYIRAALNYCENLTGFNVFLSGITLELGLPKSVNFLPFKERSGRGFARFFYELSYKYFCPY